MKKNKVKINFNGALKIYMLWPVWLTLLLLCMVLSIYVVDKQAAGIMLLYTMLYAVIALMLFVFKRHAIMRELVRFATGYEKVQYNFLKELDVPYGVTDTEGHLLWANDKFMELTQLSKTANVFIQNIFQEISLDQFPVAADSWEKETHISYDTGCYCVKMRRMDMSDYANDMPWNAEYGEEKENNTLIGVYLYDETELKKLQKENKDEKMMVGLLYIDNYEESFAGADEVQRSMLTAYVERAINRYMKKIDALVQRLEKDKYIFVFKQKYMAQIDADRFAIVEEIRNLKIYNMSLTISIGVGAGDTDDSDDFDDSSYEKSYELANAAIDLALGRGGNQAVVKKGNEVIYYGGKSVQQEKRTRVKSRVKAQALKEYILDTKDQVVIMGHANADPDSFGSAIGIYRIAKALGKKAQIVLNEVTSSIRPMLELFQNNPEYEEDMFISGSRAQEIVNDQTLLVVVDVSRPDITECKELLRLTKKIVVFDHHLQASNAIDAVLTYMEPYASSACELVSEIVQYIEGVKLAPLEAEAMYAGIMIDSNDFKIKSGVRTFEAAAYLIRCGVNLSEIRKRLRDDFKENKVKTQAISEAEVYMEHYIFAVSESAGLDSPSVVAAKTANDLLDIDNAKASFVFTELDGKVHISARSLNEVNVQVIMEKLGGGGHRESAGVQLADCTILDAINKVKEVLRKMTEEGDI